MNIPTLVIGIAGLLFGLYTIYGRSTHPEKFGKLIAMQQKFGEKRGTSAHMVFYSVIPIVFGIILIFAGIINFS